MKTDGIECMTKKCNKNHKAFRFSCAATEGLNEKLTAKPVIECAGYNKRTPEHETVVKTLRELCIRYKQDKSGVDKATGESKHFWGGSKSANLMALRTLAHNWLRRNR